MKHSVRELYEEIGTIQKGSSRPSYDTITHGILINENIPSGRICLDLGCGGGHYLNVLEERFVQVICVDIAKSNVKKAMPRAKISTSCFVVGDAGRLPFVSGVFDFVLFTEVIEHLPNPSEGLSEIRRCLSAKGRALITTPNMAEPLRFVLYTILGPLQRSLGLDFMNVFKSSFLDIYGILTKDIHKEHVALKYGIPEHFNCFSVRRLQKLCLKAGLEPVRVDHSLHHQLLFPIATLADRYGQLLPLCFKLSRLLPKQFSTIFAIVCMKTSPYP